jgi:hypothetical protein
MNRWLPIARYGWALPCTVVGLLLALPALLLGARGQRVDGVFEVALSGDAQACPRLLRHAPWVAITFGHVVIGRTAHELACLRAHEHAHVRQYERWGALFFLAYPAASLMQLLCGKRAYRDNRFEVQARAAQRNHDAGGRK